MPGSIYRRACQECQLRHLKCDLGKPCTQCTQARRPCVEAGQYEFRHDSNPSVASGKKIPQSQQFQSNQIWAEIPQHLTFTSDPLWLFATSEPEVWDTETKSRNRGLRENLGISCGTSPSSGLEPSTPEIAPVEGSANILTVSRDEIPYSPEGTWPSLGEANHPLDSEATLWPLSNRDEAVLMRHFATELAVWFDFCDKRRHFATIVVPAAATSPILHNAIMAVSAKHLSLTRNLDSYTPDRYQQECLRLLIPALTYQDTFMDDQLFAATVILRLFQEMTEPVDEPELSAHVLGSHILMRASELAQANCDYTTTSSLRFATLNIELRQEVHIGFLTNRPPPASLIRYCKIDRNLDPADDWTWTWRIIAHAGDILAYCNGDSPKTIMGWSVLWEYLDTWKRLIPPTFRPILEEAVCHENEKFIPEIWFANDCHDPQAAAHQYLSIARILLLAHDPTTPLLGLDRNIALKENDSRIKDEVLNICGIARSNRHFKPVLFCAGIAIAMCGDRFTNRREQELFIDILDETEVSVAWPRFRARERLKKCWNWDGV